MADAFSTLASADEPRPDLPANMWTPATLFTPPGIFERIVTHARENDVLASIASFRKQKRTAGRRMPTSCGCIQHSDGHKQPLRVGGWISTAGLRGALFRRLWVSLRAQLSSARRFGVYPRPFVKCPVRKRLALHRDFTIESAVKASLAVPNSDRRRSWMKRRRSRAGQMARLWTRFGFEFKSIGRRSGAKCSHKCVPVPSYPSVSFHRLRGYARAYAERRFSRLGICALAPNWYDLGRYNAMQWIMAMSHARGPRSSLILSFVTGHALCFAPISSCIQAARLCSSRLSGSLSSSLWPRFSS